MPITAQQISDNAGILLQDVGAIRWPTTERLVWINDGRRQMAELKPNVFGAGSEVTHTLTSGAKQRITAANALKFLSADYNAGSGKACRPTVRASLDAFKPSWRSDPGPDVLNWFPDETDPLAFWIHPVAAGSLKCHIHLMPESLASLADVALPFDIYTPHLVNYVCYRAHAKEDEAASIEKAAAYLKLFVDGLS